MCSDTTSILLEGPIDYLVFSSGKINVQRVGTEIISFSGEIIDQDNGQIIINILNAHPDGIANVFCVGETLHL